MSELMLNEFTLTIGSGLSWELTWYHPGRVMSLKIIGDYTIEDSRQVNSLITDKLEESREDMVLLIDASEMIRPYYFNEIRSSQTYKDHLRLKHIYVVTADNVVKLAMMIIFNYCRANFHISENFHKLNTNLQMY